MFKKVALSSVLSLFTLMAFDNKLEFRIINTNINKAHVKTRDELYSLYAESNKVNAGLIKAICKHENPKGDANAISPKNKNGSKDYGLCQVNDRSAKELCGISDVKTLLDEETNIYCASKILASKIKSFGGGIESIRRFNGKNNSASNINYAENVIKKWIKL